MKILLFIILFASVAIAQQPPFAFIKSNNTTPLGTPSISWNQKPVNLQLYARDASDDSATVTISGTFSPDGYDSVFVRLYKNGTSVRKTSTKLNYSGIFAPFSITHRIHAELAEYKLICYVKAPLGDTTLLFSVDSVVCGDAYVIAGQSNGQNPDLNVTTNDQYCRTFGVQTDSLNLSAYSAADTTWARSSANFNDFSLYPAGNYPRNVSVLGMTLQKYIRDSCSIPTCIINGTEQGTSIITHQRNNGSPMELTRTTLYGRTLYRVTKAGLADKIKAIIWYQGEIDVNPSSAATSNNPKGISGYSTYANKFDSLFRSWKSDYTALQKVYVMQVRPLNCAGSSTNGMELREIQRQLQNTYVDTVQLFSTLGIGNYQNCHYAYQGYQQMALQLFKNIGIKFYPTSVVATTDTLYNRPPTVRKAFFIGSGKDTIAVTFNNSYPTGRPSDTLGNSIEGYFYLNKLGGWSSGAITAMSMRNDTMFLKLSGSTSATRLAYTPNAFYGSGSTVFNGPFIRNTRGLALLSFDNVPIYEAESNRLFTRMNTINRAREVLVDSVVKFCKTNSVWTGDALWVYANSDTGAANLNWLSGAADSFRCVRNGTITFTADKGYTGDGITGYLNTQFRPKYSAVNYTLNTGSLALYVHDNILTNFSTPPTEKPFGTVDSANNNYVSITPRGTSGANTNRFFTNVNDVNTSFSFSNADGRGMHISVRTSSSNVLGYKNGNLTPIYTNASQTQVGAILSKFPVYVCAFDHMSFPFYFYTGRIALVRIGGSWSAAQTQAFSQIMEYYMLQVGASYTQ